MASRTPQLLLDPSDEAAPWSEAQRGDVQAGLRQAEEALGLRLASPAWVRTFADAEAFARAVGYGTDGVAAVARPETNEVLVLRPAWAGLSRAQRRRLIAHEAAHLLTVQVVAGPLPAWLAEGIAMLASGEIGTWPTWRVEAAAALGGAMPLRALEHRVAVGGGAQELAYAQCLSVTRFWLARDWPADSRGGRDPRPLLRALSDPVDGPRMLAWVWDASWRDSLEVQWRRSLARWRHWVAAASSSSVLWGAITALFLVAVWRKRRMDRLRRRRMAEREADEAPYEALVGDWDADDET